MEKLEKQQICRICSAKNVRMYLVADKSLQKIYEKLTDKPLVTEDRRPMLACFFCYAQLKQSYQLQRKCLESEMSFAQMLNEVYEPKPVTDGGKMGGFIISPIENISIVDQCLIESDAIKQEPPAVCEEPPAVCEELCDIELKVEDLNDDFEVDVVNSYPEVEDIPLQYSEFDLKDEVTVMENKIQGEKEDFSVKKQRVRGTERAPAKKSKPDKRGAKQEYAIQAEPKKNRPLNSKIIRNANTGALDAKKPVLRKEIKKETKKKNETDVINKTFKTITAANCRNKDDLRSSTWNYEVFNSSDVNRTPSSTIPGKSFPCDLCQRSYTKKSSLNKHSRVHTGEAAYACDICQRIAIDNYDLRRHLRKHTGEKCFKCDICQTRFTRKTSLNHHLLKHAGKRPYKCDICQLSFNRKDVLMGHIRSHNGEKPYKCDICLRRFTQKQNLTLHIRRIHNGEKPYECDICQRRFTCKGSLTSHIRIVHGSENLYTCEICLKSFKYPKYLKSHLRVHMKDK